jgi:hypothetical protein
MKHLIFVLACLLSFSVYGQKSHLDSIHTHKSLNYDYESHNNSTVFKYIGNAISLIGVVSSLNGADPDKQKVNSFIIVAGGLLSYVADIGQDFQEVKLGKIVTEHIAQPVDEKMNSSVITSSNEEVENFSIKDKGLVFFGPLRIYIQRELTYTHKNGNEYLGNLIYYNQDSNCYVIEYLKNGKQKKISVYKNNHHRLSQE